VCDAPLAQIHHVRAVATERIDMVAAQLVDQPAPIAERSPNKNHKRDVISKKSSQRICKQGKKSRFGPGGLEDRGFSIGGINR
jgi:hypothetical protein